MGFIISLLRRLVKLFFKEDNLKKHKKNQKDLAFKESIVENDIKEENKKIVEIVQETKDSMKAMKEQNDRELAEIKIKEAQFSRIIEDKKQEMDKVYEEKLLKIKKKKEALEAELKSLDDD